MYTCLRPSEKAIQSALDHSYIQSAADLQLALRWACDQVHKNLISQANSIYLLNSKILHCKLLGEGEDLKLKQKKLWLNILMVFHEFFQMCKH